MTRRRLAVRYSSPAPDLLGEGTRPPESKPRRHGLEGHRERLRQRIMLAGPDALADHEVLEMVLFVAIPRRDTKEIARELIARFGSLPAVISAPPNDLKAVDGVGDAAAAAIRAVMIAAQRMMKREAEAKPVLSNWDTLTRYLTVTLALEPIEQFRCLFLNARNQIIADEVLGRGTVSHAPVYPREVARRCLELHATAVILVHNHPSGDPTPSQQDIAMTRELKQLLRSLDVVVHDHVIVGSGGVQSLRRLGFL